MNKIWIPIIIFVSVLVGGFAYNFYVSGKTEAMLAIAEKAYETSFDDTGKCGEYLDEIDERLEKISGLLCAFLDREIINDAKDSIVRAKGLAEADSGDCPGGVAEMKEKISHIRNSAQIKLKYIL